MEVKDIVKEAVIVSEDTTFHEALTKMVKEQTNTLLVIDDDGKLSGEVTVADLMDAVVPAHLDGDTVSQSFNTEDIFATAVTDASDTPVGTFMSTDFETVGMHDGILTIAATAISQQKARIPVVDNDNRPVGIISRRGLKQILARFANIADT